MFQCNDKNHRYLDIFLKSVPVEPDTSYCLSMNQYGGAFGVWINHSFAVNGSGPYYFDHCDKWTRRAIYFTTKKTPSNATHFSDWGISFFKKINSLHINGHQDSYLDHVHLVKISDPQTDLLIGGDFESTADDSVYNSNWRPMILGGVGKEMGVCLTQDPLNFNNHCLLLPKILYTPSFPDSISLRANGFGWYKNELNAPHLRDPVGLPYHLLLVVEQGALDLLTEQPPRSIAPGNAVYIPPHTPFYYRGPRGKGTGFHWIMFSGKLADELLPNNGIATMSLPHTNEVASHINQMLCFSLDSPLYPYIINAHLQLILAELSEPRVHKAKDLHEQMIDCIAAQLQEQPEQPISNAQLASKCGFSTGHFIWLFKKYKGCTPHQYYLQSLAKKACSLLADTTMTVQEISFALGIEDPLYFSHLFKKVCGVSPREYRRQQRP